MLVGCTPSETDNEDSIRIMTFNIAAGYGDFSRIVDVIREYDPGIVGLQEVDVYWSERSDYQDQIRLLSEELEMDYFFGPIYRIPHKEGTRPIREYGLGFLSRIPIVDSKNHKITRLSTKVEEPEPELKPGFPEILINLNDSKLRIYNTHLDYRPDPIVRKMQVKDMISIIDEHDTPTILLGDLNAIPGSPEILPLFEIFKDVWDDEELGPGYTFPANNPDRRIDYILVTEEIEIKYVDIIQTNASDHLPIITDIKLPN